MKSLTKFEKLVVIPILMGLIVYLCGLVVFLFK